MGIIIILVLVIYDDFQIKNDILDSWFIYKYFSVLRVKWHKRMPCVCWSVCYTRAVMSTHPVHRAVEEREKDKPFFDALHLMEPPVF